MGAGADDDDRDSTPPDRRAAPAPPPARRPAAHGGRSRVLWRIFAGAADRRRARCGAPTTWSPLLAHEERVENETFAAADVEALDVDSANGSVRIVATDTDAITVRAEISDGPAARPASAARSSNGVLELRATCPNFGSDFCWVDYEVGCPATSPIDGARRQRPRRRSPARRPPSTSTATTAPSSSTDAQRAARGDDRQRPGRGHERCASQTVRADTDNGRVAARVRRRPDDRRGDVGQRLGRGRRARRRRDLPGVDGDRQRRPGAVGARPTPTAPARSR